MQRAFYYGDLLFESISIKNGEIMLVDRHFNRLVKSASILKYELDSDFNINEFVRQIKEAIQQSQIKEKQNCRIRYTLHRTGDGFYLPISNHTQYFIDVFDATTNTSDRILNIGIYKENYKSRGELSNIKSGNALIYVLASIWAKQMRLDDALLLNDLGNIIESTRANIFWIKDNIYYTPPLSEGCISGVMREEIMSKEMVIEKSCKIEDLLNAESIFLTNSISNKKYISLSL
jgi:branched-chain amino acid aminotransferase